MPHYRWQASDAVTHAEVKENLSYRYALLHMQPGMSGDQLGEIREHLQTKGLIATKDAVGGEAIIRVRGFKKVSDLFETLHHEGLTSQTKPLAKGPLEEELNKEVQSWKQYIKKRSINLAGWTYLVADAMPIASGLATRNNAEVVQGLMWATTSVGLALFGRKDPNIQMGNMYAKMKEYLYQEGIDVDIEDKLAVERLRTEPHYWNKAINWLYENPVLFNNSLQGLGGMMQAKGGYFVPKDKQNPFKVAAGISVASGQWAGLLVPEKPHASHAPEEQTRRTKGYLEGTENHPGGDGKFMDDPIAWMQERPLRLTAIGPIINNLLAGYGAFVYDREKVHDFFKKDKKSWWNLNPGFRKNESLLEGFLSENELTEFEHYMKEGSFSAHARDTFKAAERDTIEKTKEMLDKNTARKFIAVSPIFNIAANLLYGLSSKEDRSEDLAGVGYLDEIITVAANIYAPFPDEEQAIRVSKFAGFVAYQPDVHINRDQIAEKIHAKIDELQHSPWMQRVRDDTAHHFAKAREKDRGKEVPTAVLKTNGTPDHQIQEAALEERFEAASLGLS